MSSLSLNDVPDTDRPRKRLKHQHSRPKSTERQDPCAYLHHEQQNLSEQDLLFFNPNSMTATFQTLDVYGGSLSGTSSSNTSFSSSSKSSSLDLVSTTEPEQLEIQQYQIVGNSPYGYDFSQLGTPNINRQPPIIEYPIHDPCLLVSTASTQQLLSPSGKLDSPFMDCIDYFGTHKAPRFPRPVNGQVNGYIKFNWPKKTPAPSLSPERQLSTPDLDDKEPKNSNTPRDQDFISQHFDTLPKYGPALAIPAQLPGCPDRLVSVHDSSLGVYYPSDASIGNSSEHAALRSPRDAGTLVRKQTLGNPRLVPNSFGMEAKMDLLDRKLWSFYVFNWCPGRSILKRTNFWYTDFALMQKADAIRSAIQSLAGIYIHDYAPNEVLLRRINERFTEAELRLRDLLTDPDSLRPDKASEFINISMILSMQDIVLTERQVRKPHVPRWLRGFRQAEFFLDHCDSGSRYWDPKNVQVDSLSLAQTIMVGRAMIVAQPMAALPPSHEFNPEREVKRFGWLLYGSKPEMYEIHGGCGFSKKLLHLMSQVTYCAARLQQEPESMITAMTGTYLLRELQEMKQWSMESRSWKEAQENLQTIDMVKMRHSDDVLRDIGEMTEVTAEAWRFAVIIYLQCRFMRLPRNHPEVLQSMSDLATCVRAMPTSGPAFTAQAPLFPVFLLGMLSTMADHRQTSKRWFDQVVEIPVRSSVPPLYRTLKRIWSWIEAEVELPNDPRSLPPKICTRSPWWEHLIATVTDKEEALCLT